MIKRFSVLMMSLLLSVTVLGCDKKDNNSKVENSNAATIQIDEVSKVSIDEKIKLGKYNKYKNHMISKKYKINDLQIETADGSKAKYELHRIVLYDAPDANDILIEEKDNKISKITINLFKDKIEKYEDKFYTAINDTLSCYFDETKINEINKTIKDNLDIKKEENKNLTLKLNENISIIFTKFDGNLFFTFIDYSNTEIITGEEKDAIKVDESKIEQNKKNNK